MEPNQTIRESVNDIHSALIYDSRNPLEYGELPRCLKPLILAFTEITGAINVYSEGIAVAPISLLVYSTSTHYEVSRVSHFRCEFLLNGTAYDCAYGKQAARDLELMRVRAVADFDNIGY